MSRLHQLNQASISWPCKWVRAVLNAVTSAGPTAVSCFNSRSARISACPEGGDHKLKKTENSWHLAYFRLLSQADHMDILQVPNPKVVSRNNVAAMCEATLEAKMWGAAAKVRASVKITGRWRPEKWWRHPNLNVYYVFICLTTHCSKCCFCKACWSSTASWHFLKSH